jgi:hypothetical protein
MFALRPDRNMPCSIFRLGTVGALCTLATVLRGKLDPDHLMLPSVEVGNPRRAGFALWTGGTLSLPIDDALPQVVGLRLLCLPGDIRAYRAESLNIEVVRTLHQQLGIAIARIDNMGCGGELSRRSGLMHWRSHRHIRDGGFGRLDMGNEVGCVLLTSLRHMHFIPGPGDTAFVAKVRLGVIG